MYPGALEEMILTEVVANALDSGGTRIRLLPGAANAILKVVDDGRGMQRRDLARYHIALTVALALALLAVGAKSEHASTTQFLADWGGSESRKTRPSRDRG